MTSIIQSASEIHELDKTTFSLEQDLLKVTEEERDLYKNAFEVLSAELQKRDTLILTLQHRLYPLTIPAKIEPSDELDEQPENSTPSLQAMVASLADLDQANDKLLEIALDNCQQERDLYKIGVESLAIGIEMRDEEIQELEKQIAEKERLLSKKAEQPKTVNPQSAQIETLHQTVASLKKVNISQQDREAAFQNYTFLLFIQEKGTFDLEEFITICDKLDSSDENLQQAAKKALESIDPNQKNFGKDINWASFFRSKDDNLDHKIQTLATPAGKIQPDPLRKITMLRGQADKLMASFFEKLKSLKKDQLTECNYSDFGFTRIGFIGGQILLAEMIYEKCKTSYEALQIEYANPRLEQVNDLRRLPGIIANIEKEIVKIKEVRRLLLALLEKSKFV